MAEHPTPDAAPHTPSRAPIYERHQVAFLLLSWTLIAALALPYILPSDWEEVLHQVLQDGITLQDVLKFPVYIHQAASLRVVLLMQQVLSHMPSELAELPLWQQGAVVIFFGFFPVYYIILPILLGVAEVLLEWARDRMISLVHMTVLMPLYIVRIAHRTTRSEIGKAIVFAVCAALTLFLLRGFMSFLAASQRQRQQQRQYQYQQHQQYWQQQHQRQHQNHHWNKATPQVDNLKDHYVTLGVPEGTPLEDVRRQYHQLSMQHHPDKTQDGDSSKFLEVQHAYEEIRKSLETS
mmetsp:Transcript_17929/g.21465  ORF Transcript_17929/g.21465 Transcript_17929/m.21465 type:complete len:293 (+) Transcript_17929:674-1552(+)